jgi:hypothetical protein
MADQWRGFALSVDLGTSHTVAVLRWPDGRTRPLLFDGQPLLPSGVYAEAGGRLHVGRDAQRLAQADPQRYEPNPKRRVDEPAVRLGEADLAPADLLAAILRAVADAAVATVGFLPPAVLTYPVAWDVPRREVLADALVRAGWPPAAVHSISGPTPDGTRLLREPVAAARFYTEVLRRPVPVGEAVAVFDFGGGTLDVAVVRNEGADPWGDSGFTVVAAGGMADLGGLDLDAALLGRLGELVAAGHPAVWQRLSRPGSATEARDRHQVWENVRGAKEMLSRTTVAPVAVPGVERAVELSRDDLERVAAPLLARAVDATREVITAAGLEPGRLAGLFLVGGSSRVPLVARMLHAGLGVAPTVLEQPELPVAEGALTDLPAPRTATGGPAGSPAGQPAGPGQPTPSSPPAEQPTPDAGPGRPAAPPTSTAGQGGAPQPVPYLGQGGAPQPVPYLGQGAQRAPYQPWSGGGAAQAWAGAPGPGSPGTGRPGRRWLWVTLAAVVALVGVTVGAVLYLTRDPYPDLEFQSVTEVARIGAGEDRPAYAFTSTLGDRAYLAYTRQDDRLEVVAVDAGTGRQVWRRETPKAADRWKRIVALPAGVAVLPDGSGDSPRDLVVLDRASGSPRWTRPLTGDDTVLFTGDVAVVADKAGGRLVGLDLAAGTERWTRPNPRDQYDNTEASLAPVLTDEALGGPYPAGGSPEAAWLDVARVVQVGADRSVRLIDTGTGAVVRSRTNVADHDDFVVAAGDRLYVANDDNGYRLVSYDLASLPEPTVLYTAPDDKRRPHALVPCGEHRACLLEVPNYEEERTEVVAATEGAGVARWAAPEAERLVPYGERLLALRTSPKASVTLFGADGKPVLAGRDGTAVHLDDGNLLIFAEQLSSFEDDRSVAGLGTDAGTVVELGQLKQVRSEACSWNTSVVVCPSAKDFVIYRFAAG